MDNKVKSCIRLGSYFFLFLVFSDFLPHWLLSWIIRLTKSLDYIDLLHFWYHILLLFQVWENVGVNRITVEYSVEYDHLTFFALEKPEESNAWNIGLGKKLFFSQIF